MLRLLGRNSMRARVQGRAVKRGERISLNIEHREVSVSIAQTAVTSGECRPTQVPRDVAQSENCPDCGASWLPNFQNAIKESQIDLRLLLAAILDGRLHLQCQPDGRFRVCERSFQRLRGNF
jgi:hypothetical protein